MSGAPAAAPGERRLEELVVYLRRPGLVRLFAIVREKRERLGRLGGRVTLTGATDEERQAVAGLFAWPTLPSDPVRVDLSRLDRALRESRFGVGLDEALTALGGPLRDRFAERDEAQRRWEDLWSEAAEHAALRRHPGLKRWFADLRRGGLLRRLAGQGDPRALLAAALDVLAELDLTGSSPDRDAIRLPVLASRALGSSHALDAGRPTATLVLRALASLSDWYPPTSAADRRELWDRAGVVTDELSCDVLAVGLAPCGPGPLSEALRSLAAAGEPVRLTLRQLATPGLTLPEGLVVRICENPVVVAAAADRWGPAVRPLVCIGGQPSQAARRLLGDLASRGATLLYHGDFDWPGLRIAQGLCQTLPIKPWHFGSTDYRRAVEAGAEGPQLFGEPVAAGWDAELTAAMAEAGVAVEEEAVLEELLSDLGPLHDAES